MLNKLQVIFKFFLVHPGFHMLATDKHILSFIYVFCMCSSVSRASSSFCGINKDVAGISSASSDPELPNPAC